MKDAELNKLERLHNATSCKPWTVTHVDDDGIERFSITADRLTTVCILDEDEPFDFDEDLRDEIASNFAFMAAAHAAIPKLIAEVRRLRSPDTAIIVDAVH